MQETILRKHLVSQLKGGNAHLTLKRATEGLRLEHIGQQIENLPHTIWDLVEHIRIAQDDIIEFSASPNYREKKWPDEYWPPHHSPSDIDEWNVSLQKILDGIQLMIELVKNPDNDLFQSFPYGDGQTLFREAMLIVDHNAYHIGQILQLRRLQGSW